MKQDTRIREEFEKEWKQRDFTTVDLINNWWLSKIDELLKSQREELVEKIRQYELNTYNKTVEEIKEEILSLIKEE